MKTFIKSKVNLLKSILSNYRPIVQVK